MRGPALPRWGQLPGEARTRAPSCLCWDRLDGPPWLSLSCPAAHVPPASHRELHNRGLTFPLSSQARYTGLIFAHEGWPLCVREKVVVQLASLHGVRLRPGDFYLQVTSGRKRSARLVLKCLSQLGRGSEEVTVPEAMYGCVFTGEFLEWLNGERTSVPLRNCLLTSGSAVFRTPWSSVTDPIFVPTFRTVPPHCSCPGPGWPPPQSTSMALAPASAVANTRPREATPPSSTAALPHCQRHPGSDQPSLQHSPGRAGCEGPRSPCGSSSGGLAGVGPSELGPREGPSRSLDATDKRDSPQSLTVCEDMGSPSSRRQLPRDPASVESKRWFRTSYMEALRNPMPLGSSSEESLGDEACSSQTMGARTAASPAPKETPSPWGDSMGIPSQEKRPGATRSTLPRRSRSWDRALRSRRGDTRQAAPHSAGSRLGDLPGGQAEETRSARSGRSPRSGAQSPGNVQPPALPTPPHPCPRTPPPLCPLLPSSLPHCTSPPVSRPGRSLCPHPHRLLERAFTRAPCL